MTTKPIQPTIPGGLFAKLFATFFYSGYLPKAPGTWASLFTAIILYFTWPSEWPTQLLLITVVYLFGVLVSGRAEKYYGHDARYIVIDEVAGQMTALFMAPHKLVAFALGLLLFRFFDIVKPPPIHFLEKLPGGIGVVLDDVLAGGCACVILHLISWIGR